MPVFDQLRTRYLSQRLMIVIYSVVAIGLLLVTISINLTAGQGHLLMPLDDVYIHFQYARQLALGHPYIYNDGQMATSGATSLLYPYLLAIGYSIGFKDLLLGLWALILGAIALILAMIAVNRIMRYLGASAWVALFTGLAFAGTGSLTWHFFSGMETGFVIALTLWTLLSFAENTPRRFILSAILLALLRPEAGIISATLASFACIRHWYQLRRFHPSMLIYLLPIVANFLQPLMNWAITGSAVATGNQAKSLLALIPHDTALIASLIFETFWRVWRDFIIGYTPDQAWYLPPLFGLLTILTGVSLFRQTKYRWFGVAILAICLIISLAISTLDTASWHFKRYQMPFYALTVPLVSVALLRLQVLLSRYLSPVSQRLLTSIVMLLIVTSLGAITIQFFTFQALNVSYVYQQPYQMALWLASNTAPDAVISVHDVGMMRYIGGRTTDDIVGLTTPNNASAWRNGVGAVAENLLTTQPDFIASYGAGHGYGLRYLAETSLYQPQRAIFPIVNWDLSANVALATNEQIIAEPDWDNINQPVAISQALIDHFVSLQTPTMQLLAVLDVAHIASESQFNYSWTHQMPYIGFPTEVYEWQYAYPCNMEACRVIDGGRRINGTESFAVSQIDTTQALLLVTLVHAPTLVTLDIYANDQWIAERTIPARAGFWTEIPLIIPTSQLSATTTITIIPSSGDYQPYQHAFFQGNFTSEPPPESLAEFTQGNFQLTDWSREGDQIRLQWFSNGQASGDYRLFVHLYGDTNQPPLLQWDGYPAGQTAPSGSWVAGIINDTIPLAISTLESGTYQLAIGFYDAQNPTQRLQPTSDRLAVTPDGRIWLAEIEVP